LDNLNGSVCSGSDNGAGRDAELREAEGAVAGLVERRDEGHIERKRFLGAQGKIDICDCPRMAGFKQQ
jgi:hypothetical protein